MNSISVSIRTPADLPSAGLTAADAAVIAVDLTAAYGSSPVLNHVSLSVPKGVMAAILGPNGAGKTTLLKSLTGLLKPVSGTVAFGALRKQIGYVPQSSSVDRDFPVTALDVVLMGCYGRLGLMRRPGKKESRRAPEILNSVGMREYADRQIGALSGGQRQRVFLARALMQEAEIYLMDEPFRGVDQATEAVMISLLKQRREEGKTILIVHHDLKTVTEYFDWVILINRGIIASGPVHEVYTRERIAAAFQALPVWEEDGL